MECIIVCGTVSSNRKAAQLLVEANIHHHLINLLKGQQTGKVSPHATHTWDMSVTCTQILFV